MRKTLSVFASRMKGLLSLLALVCVSAGSAAAADVDSDFGTMELNKDYVIQEFKSYAGVFTAPETGELKVLNVEGGANVTTIYADANHETQIGGTHSGYTANPSYYSFNVTAGTTYYFWDDFPFNGGTIRLEMSNSAAFELQKSTPEQGSVLSITNAYPYIDLLFTAKVKSISSCKFTCNGTTRALSAGPSGHTLQISYGTAVQAMYDANAPEGSDITIAIEGLTNDGGVLYNGDGKLTLTYKLGKKPVTMISNQLPEQFKSYWPANDPAAIATFTFSAPLSTSMPADAVRLTFGSPETEGNEFYYENVPFTVEGNVLKVDLAGVRRTPADMVASGTNYNNITLSLAGIKAANGDYVYSAGQGAIGSFGYMWSGDKYVVISKGTISAEFDPANGTSLKNANQIEVWMQGDDIIKFDGFTLTAEDNGEVTTVNVPMSSVTVAKGSDGNTYTFNIPAEIKGKNGVTVTLTNVVGLDGYDHADDVKASYDTFVVISCDPANGTEMAALESGQTITIDTNYASLYPELYIEYQITDLNAKNPDQAIVKTMVWMNRQEDGTYKAEIAGSGITLFKGHKYEVLFTAWESEMNKNYGADALGTAKVYWYGTSEPFTFSEVKFVSITPAPSANFLLTPDDNVFTVKFDGGVNLDKEYVFINTGQGTKADFESILPTKGGWTSEDGKTINDEWTLTISKSWLQSWDAPVMISITAFDENGKRVEGNTGEDETSYLLFTYNTANEYREVTVTPEAGSEVEELSRFVVKSDLAIAQSYFGEAYLLGMDKTRYELTVSMPAGDETTDNKEMYLDLSEPITKAGTYTLIIDPGFFNIGTEFSAWKSKGIEAAYYVKEKEVEGDDNRTLTPDPADQTIKSLSSIEVVFPDYEEISLGAGKATLTIGAARETINLPDAELDWDMWNKATQPLGNTYTEKGTYTVNFPAGYFNLGTDGKVSKAFAAVYTIGDSVGVDFVVADENGVYNVFNMAGVKVMTTADAADFVTLPAGIYIINGKKIAIR